MLLPIALVLFVVFVAGLLVLIVRSRRQPLQGWPLVAVSAVTALSLLGSCYFTVSFIGAAFADNISKETTLADLSIRETTQPVETTQATEATTPTTQTTEKTTETTQATTPTTQQTTQQTTQPTQTQETAAPSTLDNDQELLYPDIFGLSSRTYPESMVFSSANEVAEFILHNLLNDQFSFNFYLDDELATYDEGTAYAIMSQGLDSALAYYLFSAFDVYTMMSEVQGDEVLATIDIRYQEPDFDLEARREAVQYVLENPVPEGGFTDYDSERAYAHDIHDYIARRITYSPIGYSPELMLSRDRYEIYQEAYNVLASPEQTAVCAGYARGFALIAQYAGINAVYVWGNETDVESHAWNVIYPCDGSEPVLVDVTWNDSVSGDVEDQEYVSDYYFYLPLSDDFEHEAAPHYAAFLDYMNGAIPKG